MISLRLDMYQIGVEEIYSGAGYLDSLVDRISRH